MRLLAAGIEQLRGQDAVLLKGANALQLTPPMPLCPFGAEVAFDKNRPPLQLTLPDLPPPRQQPHQPLAVQLATILQLEL